MNEEFDVSPGEMHHHELTEAMVNGLIEGTELDPELEDLAGFIDELRCFSTAVGEPVATGALVEFVGVDLVTDKGDLPAMAASNAHGPAPQVAGLPSHEPDRRSTMLTKLTAFAGTIAGKSVIGTAVALASVGGAHSADLIDVPGLPDDEAAVAVVDPETPAEDEVDEDDVVDVEPIDDEATETDTDDDTVEADDVEDAEEADDIDEVEDAGAGEVDEVDETPEPSDVPDYAADLAELDTEQSDIEAERDDALAGARTDRDEEIADIEASYAAELAEIDAAIAALRAAWNAS